MDRRHLARIDEELDSLEVAALCFLCCDVVNKKRLQGIKDAKELFRRLEERGLLENSNFLHQLLRTIQRADLVNLLETDSRPTEDTDASPILSDYRVMLYKIYEGLTQENLAKLKFLLDDRLPRRQMDLSETALKVFMEMEKKGLMSNTDVNVLHEALQGMDEQLAWTVQRYRDGIQRHIHPHANMDDQRANSSCQEQLSSLSISETLSSYGGESVCADAQPTITNYQETPPSTPNHQPPQPSKEPPFLADEKEYYALCHEPRGLCVIINNEEFDGPGLRKRAGTQEDQKALGEVFSKFGFTVVEHNDLTAEAILQEVEKLGTRNFLNEDALVVCVLSHGEKGSVFGSDEREVSLRDITRPFTSGRAPTLAGKPKLFFIQACQGSGYQRGSLPCPLQDKEEEDKTHNQLEEDAGPVYGTTVPQDADFLLGMATVPECRSFRNTTTGSIYIQELCKQLKKSAESSEADDLLTVLTRVNREVSRGDYSHHKQMPEPKYTLTKKLVFRFV